MTMEKRYQGKWPHVFCRLLLDTEEWCTWRQIPAKIICFYILAGSFCLFHEHVKLYFAHLYSSVSLIPCLIEKFCIHIWIQHKKYLMEAIPLCDIIEVYNIYLRLYTTTFQNSEYLQILLVRGDMFRLLMQPYSGQLKVEQEPKCAHNIGSHVVYIWSTCEIKTSNKNI